MKRAGKSRIPDAAWWPEIELMLALGYTVKDIAIAINLQPRRVNQIRHYGNAAGSTIYRVEEPKAISELSEETQAMCQFNADGFELFFNAFSGKTLPPHAKEWVAEFCENTNLLLNVPPRHAKTTIFSVWVPCWLIAMDRNAEVILVSKTALFARRQAAEIAYNLRHNRKMVEAFGRFAPDKETPDVPWRPSSGDLMVEGRTRDAQSGQLTIRAVGLYGQILGMEATAVIIDDVTDSGISRNETQRETLITWVKEEVLTRLMPGGRATVVGQRVHFLDLYGELSADVYKRDTKTKRRGDPLWTTISHPAVLVWPNDALGIEAEVLWPDLWDFETLMDTYERIGSTSFDTMYQQQPLPAGSRLVQPEWWDRCRDMERNGFQGVKLEEAEGGFLPVSRVLSLDPSPTQFNGFIVADVPYQRAAFDCAILEAKHWVGGMRTIVSELDRAITQYNPDFLIIEHSTFTNWLHEDPLFQSLSKRTTVLGHNCVDEQTQALSKRGWLGPDELTIGDEILTLNMDSGLSEWKPVEYVYSGDYTGPMMRFDTRGIDALVTPDHKWPRTSQYMTPLRFQQAKDLTTGAVLPLARPLASSSEPPRTYGDDFVELVGWAVTDGHFANNAGSLIVIGQSETANWDKVQRIRQTLKGAGAHWTEGYNHNRAGKVRVFKITGEVARKIRKVSGGVAGEKFIHRRFLLALTFDQRERLIETLRLADGWTQNGSDNFCSQSPSLIAAWELLCALNGNSTYSTTRSDGQDMHTSLRKAGTHVYLQNQGTRPYRIEYSGRVWCPNTENQTFYAKRGGRAYFTGNTGKNKGDANLGLESLGGDVEFARISLPYGDEAGRQMSKLLEDEANVWPNGKHDDVLLALWFIKWNYKRLIPRGVLPTQFRNTTVSANKSWRNREEGKFDAVKWYRKQKQHAS